MATITDLHALSILQVCRIGGATFSFLKKSSQYSVKEFSAELTECFGIDVSGDIAGVHPPNFCFICRSVLRRHQAAVAAGKAYERSGGCGEVQQWKRHTRDCEFCLSRSPERLRGRRKKRTRLATGAAKRAPSTRTSVAVSVDAPSAYDPAEELSRSLQKSSDSDPDSPALLQNTVGRKKKRRLAPGSGKHVSVTIDAPPPIDRARPPSSSLYSLDNDSDISAPSFRPARGHLVQTRHYFDSEAGSSHTAQIDLDPTPAAKTTDDLSQEEEVDCGIDCTLEELLKLATPVWEMPSRPDAFLTFNVDKHLQTTDTESFFNTKDSFLDTVAAGSAEWRCTTLISKERVETFSLLLS